VSRRKSGPEAFGEFREPPVARMRELLGAMVGRRVVVVGDATLDAYVIGEVERISPEAPAPVLAVEREEFMLGGAANVAKSLVALGARASLCTAIGEDADGALFRGEAVNLGIPSAGILADRERLTRTLAEQLELQGGDVEAFAKQRGRQRQRRRA
jgi:bifunctional ADP-heptose synthase (sugar kinase/adenylyltransferase)